MSLPLGSLKSENYISELVSELHDISCPTSSPSIWTNSMEQFMLKWDYPAAIAALDGMHIACVKSESLYDICVVLWCSVAFSVPEKYRIKIIKVKL